MLRTAFLALLLLGGTAQAAECTISNARYENADAPWWLSFKPVPRFSAPNQTAAFIIEMPNSGVVLEGGVHQPNGFGSPLWSVSGPCGGESTEICEFLGDELTAMYGNYDDGVRWLDDTRGATAPRQVILPRLSVSLWYSMYRGDEFDGSDGSDVFTLVGCD